MQNNAGFLSTLEQRCVITRLMDEMREAFREFREDPQSFVAVAFKRDNGGSRRKALMRLGLAISLSLYAIAFLSIIVFWMRGHNGPTVLPEQPIVMLRLPLQEPKIDLPKDYDDAGGGGGGGRGTLIPASIGNVPVPSLADPIVAPRPEPTLNPPKLPVIETVKVDPRVQFNRDDLLLTGLPDGAGLVPSAGPGSDSGIGSGAHGGVGPGTGPGVGPGQDGGIGGGLFHNGGRRPGPADQAIVDARPILLNSPHPFYTEEARKNKLQGTVKVRVLVDENGAVKQVVVTRGLPDGLSEQAVRAAYQMQFRPAMKDGRKVSYWLGSVEIEFNLR